MMMKSKLMINLLNSIPEYFKILNKLERQRFSTICLNLLVQKVLINVDVTIKNFTIELKIKK